MSPNFEENYDILTGKRIKTLNVKYIKAMAPEVR